MAVCKRCGTSFNYDKREGVCPKCCFYNRPDNAWQEDDSWVKNYNYEDNSYDITTHDSDGSDEDDRLGSILHKNKDSQDQDFFRIMGHGQDKEVDGSHVHLDNGKIVKSPVRQSTERAAKETKKKMNPILIVIIIWFILGLCGNIMAYLF